MQCIFHMWETYSIQNSGQNSKNENLSKNLDNCYLTFVGSRWRVNVFTYWVYFVAWRWQLILNHSTRNIKLYTMSWNSKKTIKIHIFKDKKWEVNNPRIDIEKIKKRIKVYLKLFLRVRKLPSFHFCIHWSHSGIGTVQLLYNFAAMLFCYSSSYGRQRPILLSMLDKSPRSSHYLRLLDSIYLWISTYQYKKEKLVHAIIIQ